MPPATRKPRHPSASSEAVTALRFTEATPAEAALVARMVRRAFRPQAAVLGVTKENHPYYAAFQTAARVRQRMAEGGHVLLAWLGDTPVGTLTYVRGRTHPDDGWIERVAVLPEYQGRHIGEAMMAQAEKQLRRAGAAKLRLAIVQQFDHLRRFYGKQGYATVETKQFPGVPFAVEIMEKPA